MAAGVLLSGIVAYATVYAATGGVLGAAGRTALTPFGQLLYTSPLRWVIMLAPLAFVFFLAFRVHALSVGATQIAFWLFAAVMGVSLSSIFLVFKLGSIANIFFITAAMFAALSAFGYTTKKDLSGWGTFLFMGVIGLLLASIVNIFLASPALQFAISCIAVLVFAGLTAYDTQRLKDEYYTYMGDAVMAAKGSIMGALSLYLNFINMFTSMLSLFGDRE
jgi:hypothetical protein